MVTVKGEGGGCVCGVVLEVARWTLAEWQRSEPFVLSSCAIRAAHQVSAFLLFLSPALLSCCRPKVSGRLKGEQTLNVNETAERKLIFSLCLSLSESAFILYLQAA